MQRLQLVDRDAGEKIALGRFPRCITLCATAATLAPREREHNVVSSRDGE
jgi:hypothetical protein